ncbi:hypothetical protein Mgra_00003796 [Meloidogyne graminicola]|uniref:Uncharacterized protein n=1 Tax=Meloidogyne graminicola TaxID=189291 RepID=A0A8S9ZT27_9BILA|nr:hypothetical protein Mgra_00003796 [Meloidogyne graminicola]
MNYLKINFLLLFIYFQLNLVENSSKDSTNIIKVNSPEGISIPKKKFRGQPPRPTIGELSLPKKEIKTELKTPNFPKKFRGKDEQIGI